MFRNMTRSLLTYGRIRTTEAKAMELRKVADGLVTLGLKNDLHARRLAYKVLENHQLVKKLFDEIAPRFSGIKGGYTRVYKLGLPRVGDCAPLAVIELTRREEAKEAPEASEAKETKGAKAPKETTETAQETAAK